MVVAAAANRNWVTCINEFSQLCADTRLDRQHQPHVHICAGFVAQIMHRDVKLCDAINKSDDLYFPFSAMALEAFNKLYFYNIPRV